MTTDPSAPSRATSLAQARAGVALTEFALALPLLLVMASSGLELANYIATVKQISEIAVMVADNASRMGAQSQINNKPISEAEINDVFTGADLQATGLNLPANARIILSSLQQNDKGGQMIKWQRCHGALAYASAYGVEGFGATDTRTAGIGPAGHQVTASRGTAVMVVEIRYRYRPIVPFVDRLVTRDIRETAIYNVRDSRDLTQVYNTEAVMPSLCKPA